VHASGFTLIELVITVAMIALLASAAIPVNELVVQRSKEQELRRALRELRQAIDAHKQAAEEGRIKRLVGESGYPKRLEDLVEGLEDLKNPKKERIYFLRRIPRDPFSLDPALAAGATWGKRSHASAAEDPREGEDVFDVFSLTPAKGINGRPYREW
jgi:general secretion pathway protein G